MKGIRTALIEHGFVRIKDRPGRGCFYEHRPLGLWAEINVDGSDTEYLVLMGKGIWSYGGRPFGEVEEFVAFMISVTGSA